MIDSDFSFSELMEEYDKMLKDFDEETVLMNPLTPDEAYYAQSGDKSDSDDTSSTSNANTLLNKIYAHIVCKDPNLMPKYSHNGDAGLDVRANVHKDSIIHIEPGETKIIPLGFKIKMPPHYELQIRSRSGLCVNNGLIVLNSPGTIDSNYTGEVMAILHNVGDKTFHIRKYDRIAQIVPNHVPVLKFKTVKLLKNTERSEDGFGSSGIN